MNWQQQQVSIYSCPADNTGRIATVRDILFTDFAIEHEWYFKAYNPDRWISGTSNDMQTICDLRSNATVTKDEKVMLKQTLQCWTPASQSESKKKGHTRPVHRTYIMQLDFDYKDIQDYDIDELKQAVFSLPFVVYVGLSCSGTGFYALCLIAEPEKLEKYAEHCFKVFADYGIQPDTSKGRNPQDLRFVSYDANCLIRDHAEPLRITHFKALKQPPKPININTRQKQFKGSNVLVNKHLELIRSAEPGNRFPTVQKVAYTFGGMANNAGLLDAIIQTIQSSSQFVGVENKYIQCAHDCFADGMVKPLTKSNSYENQINHSTKSKGRSLK